MNPTHVFRWIRATLLLSTGLVIVKLLVVGQMALYMSPALNPLTMLAGCLIALMGLLELRAVLFSDRQTDGGVTHEREAPADQLLTSLVVLLPLALGLVFTPKALGSSALGGEDITGLITSFAPMDAAAGSPALADPPAPRQPVQDFPDLFQYLRQAGVAGVGQHVRVLGMVTHSDALASNEFVLLRYSIVHCVADARPVGLLVQAPPDGSWSDDQWVAIDGTLASRPQRGDRLVSIVADRVAPIDEPSEPYLPSLL